MATAKSMDYSFGFCLWEHIQNILYYTRREHSRQLPFLGEYYRSRSSNFT